MTLAGQAAAFAASVAVVLAAVAAAARYLGRYLARQLTEQIRKQLAELVERNEQDHRVMRADITRIDDRLAAHETFHMEHTERRPAWRRS